MEGEINFFPFFFWRQLMPLVKSKSKRAFGENIRREMHAGKPRKQAIAIAYSVKRKAGG